MRIAFSSEDDRGLDAQISHHFGRCPYYTFVEVEDGEVVSVESEKNPYYDAHAPGVVPGYIASKNAHFIVAGGMGPRAVGFFEEYGISPVVGVTGIIRDVLRDILEGRYETVNLRSYDPSKHDRHKNDIDRFGE